MSRIEEDLAKIENIKNDIYTSIAQKGGDIASTTFFEDYPEAVLSITGSVRTESFSYSTASDDATTVIPTTGGYGYNDYNNGLNKYPINWVIDWGDGSDPETVTHAAHEIEYISHTFETNGSHTVTISANGNAYSGWLKAYGNAAKTALTDTKTLLTALTSNMMVSEGVPQNLCSYMFTNQYKVYMGTNFNLPQDISIVGDYAFYCMFSMDTESTTLVMGDAFNLPQEIVSAGMNFCASMFYHCTALTMNSVFNLPQTLISTGDYALSAMFNMYGSGIHDNTTLSMNSVFNFPQLLKYTGKDFAYNMFNSCKGLMMSPVLTCPQNIAYIPYRYMQATFRGCSSITMNSVFNFTQGPVLGSSNHIAFCMENGAFEYIFRDCVNLDFNTVCCMTPAGSAGNYWYMEAFRGCTSLTHGAIQFFGNHAFSPVKNNMFNSTFRGCTSLTETISPETIRQLQAETNYRTYCFDGCTSADLTNCPENWK